MLCGYVGWEEASAKVARAVSDFERGSLSVADAESLDLYLREDLSLSLSRHDLEDLFELDRGRVLRTHASLARKFYYHVYDPPSSPPTETKGKYPPGLVEHPHKANPEASRVLVIKPFPINWVYAHKRPGTGWFVKKDDGEESVTLEPRDYGKTWVCLRDRKHLPADALVPLKEHDAEETDETWGFLFDDGWILGYRRRGLYFQECGSRCGIGCSISCGCHDNVSVQLDASGCQRMGVIPTGGLGADLLVRHPVFSGKWIGATRKRGRYWLKSHPGDLPVPSAFARIGDVEDMGRTWKLL